MEQNTMERRVHTPLVAAAVVAALGPAGPVLAQTGERATIEEVLVTAQRREQSLQEVPVAVSAMSERQIESAFAQNGKDLEGMSPNLVFDRVQATPGGAALSIRGISFQDVEKSFDPAVGVVLDGIYLGTNTGQLFQVFDLERIEVLRGPQGTLFGKNTIGGLINLIRTQPTGEWGGKARVRAGSFDRREIDGVLNFPIVEDVLAGKVTYSNRQEEGWYDNAFLDGEPVGALDYEAYTVNLLWTPSDTVSVEYTYQRENDDSDAAPLLNVSGPTDLVCLAFGQCGQGGDVPQTGDRYVVNQNFSDFAFIELDAHTFEVGWQLDDAWRIDYLYGYRGSDERMDQDFDATPIDFFSTVRRQEFEQQSHELRLTYDAGDRLSFVAGGYLWNSEYQLGQETLYFFDVLAAVGAFPPIPGPLVQIQATDHETDSYALFAQADFDVTDRLTVTLGGRYTDEEKTMARAVSVETGLPAGTPGFATGFVTGSPVYPEPANAVIPLFSTYGDPVSKSWSEFDPRAGLTFQWSDDIMLYGMYSGGFRSGGFNGRAITLGTATEPFDPETVDNYELGIKSEWLDNRLRLNVAAFLMNYDDKQEEVVQVTATGDQETVVQNASQAEFQGVEIELLAVPVEGWTVQANFGWLDAEYDEFCADINGAAPPAPGQTVCGPVVGDIIPTDNTGLELRRAPEITYALSTTYEWQAGPGFMSVNASYRYKDDYWVAFEPRGPVGVAESHGILDAAIGYDLENFGVRLFGRNLTDEEIENSALFVAGLFTFSTTSVPRTWGVEAVYRFGGDE